MSKTGTKKWTTGKKGSTQVPGQLYGYSVQESRLLAHLLLAEEGDVVSLEVIDDVGVVGATGTTAEQTKSGLAHNPISDLAKDLWKTLSNWLTAIRAGSLPSDAKFLLYVAQPHTGQVVQQISDAKTHAEALALLRQLRDRFWGKPPAYKKRAKLGDEVAPHVNAILSAQDNVVVDLFRNFVIETAVANPNDDLNKLLRSKALDDKAIDDVSRYLLGWVKKRSTSSSRVSFRQTSPTQTFTMLSLRRQRSSTQRTPSAPLPSRLVASRLKATFALARTFARFNSWS